MRRLLPLLLPVAVLVLAGCASAADEPAEPTPGTGDAAAGDPAAGGIAQADNDLQIEIDLGDGGGRQTWTLTCVGFVEGSHPAAQAACDHLAAMDDPFAPIPADAMCTEVYGGPETARVLGRWGGAPVDLELSRVDGCRIAQWDSLVPVVPAPAG
jgi:hypothetical protein